MDFRFSKKYANMSGSAIRAIFALLKDPDMISFAGGMPGSDTFPYDKVEKSANRLLSGNDKVAMLQYGQTKGYAPLLDTLCKTYGVEAENLQVTTGAQQGLDLISKAFLDEGDTILVENPTFLGALQTFKLYGVNIVPVNIDENGLIIDDLIKTIEEYNPKFLYCIPNFQNPTGYTTSTERRKEIARLATKHNMIVIEDDPYGKLRYEGEELPTIQSFDKSGHVIYVSSFSKVISPGLRVGAVVGHKDIIGKLNIGAQSTTVHTAILNQAIVNDLICDKDYDSHLNTIIGIYKEKRDAMINELSKLSDYLDYNVPKGGLFIWCAFKDKTIDAGEVFKKAVEKKVAFVPGTPFYCDDVKKNTFRMNFSAVDIPTIKKGVALLSEVISEVVK